MPINPSYPGVYIEEVPSAVRTITGVSTSITAFIGRALRGEVNQAKIIHSFDDYIRVFGGLWKKSNLSYAVYQYFLNGGMDAIIVRVYTPTNLAGVKFPGKAIHKIANSTILELEAANPGNWGRNLDITIDHDVDEEKEKLDGSIFNITFEDNTLGFRETFLNVSTYDDSPRFITRVLEESDLVRVHRIALGQRPPKSTTKESLDQEARISLVENSASDGNLIEGSYVIGNELNKTGIYALDTVDFNLLCIPPYNLDNTPEAEVYDIALKFCLGNYAILIVDPPKNWKSNEEPKRLEGGIDSDIFNPKRHENAAIYFPRIKVVDPLADNRVREFVPCGVVAGVIARTDMQTGIWKSPAGIGASIKGISDLSLRLTDEENGELNQLGINCLRILPNYGPVIWGARTMLGSDRLANQWKYLVVRRVSLYIEKSLYRGTQWVVFEPNDEKLWSQIRLNVGAFMHNLFRQGAFQGTDPKKAYFVKCDNETTTNYDIDRGIVNIIVGFAPLKPAEFIILKIQQIAGQENS